MSPDPLSQTMITPTDVLEYLYCPRFTYFLNVLRISQYEDRRYKVKKGRSVHEKRVTQNREYLRKKIPTLRKEINVYLADPAIGVRGIVDEILFLKDGTIAPVDYKFTPYKDYVFKTHKIQITLYGILIEKTYKTPVRRGYIAYIRGGSKTHEIELNDTLKRKSLEIKDKILQIISTEKVPKRTREKIKYRDCTYKNICV